MDQVVAQSVAEPRFYMLLLTIFAGVALVLAAVGIFGVTSFAVLQRTREIGIRLALGASGGGVLRQTIMRAMRAVLLGLGLGLVLTLALRRVVAGMLYGVGPADPLTLIGVALLLAGVGLLASWIPARRATRVDPMVALRAE